jgi:hypothetical protein
MEQLDTDSCRGTKAPFVPDAKQRPDLVNSGNVLPRAHVRGTYAWRTCVLYIYTSIYIEKQTNKKTLGVVLFSLSIIVRAVTRITRVR